MILVLKVHCADKTEQFWLLATEKIVLQYAFSHWGFPGYGSRNVTNSTSLFVLLSVLIFSHVVGFLPQFGPCFINFYGSPREYHRLTLDKYEDLNKGIVSKI